MSLMYPRENYFTIVVLLLHVGPGLHSFSYEPARIPAFEAHFLRPHVEAVYVEKDEELLVNFL